MDCGWGRVVIQNFEAYAVDCQPWIGVDASHSEALVPFVQRVADRGYREIGRCVVLAGGYGEVGQIPGRRVVVSLSCRQLHYGESNHSVLCPGSATQQRCPDRHGFRSTALGNWDCIGRQADAGGRGIVVLYGDFVRQDVKAGCSACCLKGLFTLVDTVLQHSQAKVCGDAFLAGRNSQRGGRRLVVLAGSRGDIDQGYAHHCIHLTKGRADQRSGQLKYRYGRRFVNAVRGHGQAHFHRLHIVVRDRYAHFVGT